MLLTLCCSSISSGLNALAIVILEDFIKLIWEWRDIHPRPVVIARLAKVIGIISTYCGKSNLDEQASDVGAPVSKLMLGGGGASSNIM